MYILAAPEDADPTTLRPTSEWRLSARTARALEQREQAIAAARQELAALSDDELRARAADELEGESFPDVATMTRDEMLDFLAEPFGGDPVLEVIYPGADDATA
jgi:hypothetical protein